MVIHNENEEEETNLTIKLVIKKPMNSDDQNLTPDRNMEPEVNQVVEASTSNNPTLIATLQTNCGISSEAVKSKPKLVINLKTKRTSNGEEGEQLESTIAPKNSLPWNLRTRRSKCEMGNVLKNDSKERNNSDNKIQMSELRVQLTNKEIEEDLKAMLGHPLEVKRKKRSKVVRKHLDNTFPGLNLKDIKAKRYKVSGFYS